MPRTQPHARRTQTGSCSSTIRSAYEGLPPGERRVADYVLGDADVVYRSITEVVEQSGAGYGTVMRFCRRLGCAGFQEFKVRLAKDLALREPAGAPGDDDALAAAARAAREDIRATEETLSRPDLQRAADALAAAGSVLVAGVGGSGSTAMELEYRLTRLGVLAVAATDVHVARVRAALLGKGDAAVLASFSGATRDVLEVAEVARHAGARVIALTNHARSPLCERSHACLATAVAAGPLASEIAPRAAVAVVVDAVCRAVAARKKTSTASLELTARADADAQM